VTGGGFFSAAGAFINFILTSSTHKFSKGPVFFQEDVFTPLHLLTILLDVDLVTKQAGTSRSMSGLMV
jgi:hypothetical protein